MNNTDLEQLSSTYYIYENLTPNKSYSTYVASFEHDPLGSLLILKEMDAKRAHIYSALTNIWNPYIANVYSVQTLPSSKTHINSHEEDIYLAITECVSDTSLSQFIQENGPLNIKDALQICIQLCEGLSEFHKLGFVHRDIKPDNIMMSSCSPNNLSIKIIDFGGAKKYQKNSAPDTTVIGTLGYQAPESLSSSTQASADIFSIGCVLNYVLTGVEPGLQKYNSNSAIVSIIEKATYIDPSMRYTSVDQFKNVLLHELRFYIIDKIPLIRSIPGFRTHNCWHMLIASFVYITFFYIISKEWLQQYYWESFEILIFFLTIPLIFICNLGNFLHYIPWQIRTHGKLFLFLRIICILISLSIPFLRVLIFN